MVFHKSYCVYILTNKYNTVLYTGVTNSLSRRTFEHKSKLVQGFALKYNLTKLVYYEIFDNPEIAIKREKTIKNLLRRKKDSLINNFNPEWEDLYFNIFS